VTGHGDVEYKGSIAASGSYNFVTGSGDVKLTLPATTVDGIAIEFIADVSRRGNKMERRRQGASISHRPLPVTKLYDPLAAIDPLYSTFPVACH